jgi:hypothetical protein
MIDAVKLLYFYVQVCSTDECKYLFMKMDEEAEMSGGGGSFIPLYAEDTGRHWMSAENYFQPLENVRNC